MSDLNLNVAMIGPRGCGKTSVLSIMLGEIDNFINKLNLDKDVRQNCSPKIQADSFSVQTLKGVYQDLQSVAIRKVEENGVGVVMSSSFHQVLPVDLTVCNITTTIAFHDFPGAYFVPEFHPQVSEEELTNCKKVISEADVIVLCVDVPSQISYSDKNMAAIYASYTNYITKLVKESLENLSANNLCKTVLVLPVKSEFEILDTKPDPHNGYVQSMNPGNNDILYGKVRNLYKELFACLEKEDFPANAFYVPVITMGCVKATGMEYDVDSGRAHVEFGPVVEKQDLHYYQCNSSALLALCLWSAWELITEKYKENAGFFTKVLNFFRGKLPTEYFKDELFKECSLIRMVFEYWERKYDPNSLSEEQKKVYQALEQLAQKEPYNGCRLI